MTGHEQFAEDLTLFALGELEEKRAAEYRQHLEECSVCRQEYEQIQADAALLALSATGSAPPARARARLMKAAGREPRIRTMVQSRPRWWALAPVFASAVLAIFAILLWSENNELRENLAEGEQESAGTQQELIRARQIVSTLTSPHAVHMTLVTMQQKPQPQGRLVYEKNRGGLVFLASHMESLPADKTYELWLIPMSGGAPMAAGMFRPDARGMASVVMPTLPPNIEAKMFAITIEQAEGSATPTMPMVMASAS